MTMEAHMIEYVEIVHRYPLWASIPAELRVTVDALKYSQQGDAARAKNLALLINPGCEIAVMTSSGAWQWGPGMSNKWAPCGRPIVEGQTRCPHHGGERKFPPRSATAGSTFAAVKAENEALRQRLAELEHPSNELTAEQAAEVAHFEKVLAAVANRAAESS